MKLSSIGGLFFKTVDDEVPQTASQQTVSASQPTVQQTQINQPQSIVGQEDKEIKQQLLDALEKANLPGYDYFEFIKAIDAQMTIIPSEAMRFQSSFAMASTMGVTVQTLLTSAQHYSDTLSAKEKEFISALEKHSIDAVGGKEGQISAIDSEMKKMAEQIQKLTQDINLLQEQRTVLTNEISTNRIKIDTVKNNFNATLKTINDRIINDINKIKQYLDGGK